jgi:hypothetical protein
MGMRDVEPPPQTKLAKSRKFLTSANEFVS